MAGRPVVFTHFLLYRSETVAEGSYLMAELDSQSLSDILLSVNEKHSRKVVTNMER